MVLSEFPSRKEKRKEMKANTNRICRCCFLRRGFDSLFYLFIGLVTTFWLESTRSQRMGTIVSVDISFVSLISEGVFLLPFVREKRGGLPSGGNRMSLVSRHDLLLSGERERLPRLCVCVCLSIFVVYL